jgi:hypothetical protein
MKPAGALEKSWQAENRCERAEARNFFADGWDYNQNYAIRGSWRSFLLLESVMPEDVLGQELRSILGIA